MVNVTNNKDVLVVRLLERGFAARVPLLLRPLLYQGPILLVNVAFFIARWQSIQVDVGLFIGLILAALCIHFLPVLIYKYHRQVHARFWRCLQQVVKPEDREKVEALYHKISKRGRALFVFIFVCWLAMIGITVVLGIEKFQLLGIRGFQDAFLIVLLVDIVIGAYLTSIGLNQTLMMVFTMYCVKTHLHIPIDINNEDGVGNYSLIFKYCFPTTLYIGIGVLFIPVLVEFTSGTSSLVVALVLALIVFYSVLLLLSLVIPLYFGYRMADEAKSELLYQITCQLNQTIDKTIEHPSQEGKLRIDAQKQKLELAKGIPIYPFTLQIILKIAGTTLLPVGAYILKLVFTPQIQQTVVKTLQDIF